MTEATNTPTLAETLASSMYTVEIRKSGSLRRSFADASAKTLVATSTGSDESSLSVSRKLFPKGYDDALKQANEAELAVSKHIMANTTNWDFGGNGKAKGRRLLTSRLVVDGVFFAENRRLVDACQQAGEVFALSLSNLVWRIETDGVLGSAFDQDKYPTEDDVRRAYTFEYIETTLEPIPSSGLIPATSGALQRAQDAYADRLESRYRFGMQRATTDLAAYVGNIAERMSEWAEWEATPEYQRAERFPNRTKAPALHASLFTNVSQTVTKLREYAIPDTDDGAKLMSILDDIEASLQPDRLTPEAARATLRGAETIADTAGQLANAIEDLGLFA